MTVAGELVKELLRMIEDENESGNLVEVRRSRAPSLILPSPTHPALLPPHSRSLGSSRPASSPSTRPRQLPAVQASLPLTEQATCRDFLHVLAARDEPAAPVVVVCCCITLCLSLCGSLWWCGVCRRGRSEWRSECAVTFHRVCMVWGHVYYDSKHSDSPGHVSTKQGHLWRKQLVDREYYDLQSYFCTCRATPSRRRRARRRPATPPWAPWACVGPARHARGPFRAGCAMRSRCPAPPQMETMGPHAPYEARRVVLMAGFGALDPLGAHARARMARGGRRGRGPRVPKGNSVFQKSAGRFGFFLI